MPLVDCLQTINDWWMSSPWCPYLLHWDDRQNWPSPWDLLTENRLCGLARSLGIAYTILLLRRADTGSVLLAVTDQGNLVLGDDGKYILNWNSGHMLNIHSTNIAIKRTLDASLIYNLSE